MEESKMREFVGSIAKNMRVTKVVATRSVKTKGGDFFAGISSAWDSRQDDASGPGADLDLLVTTAETANCGMSLLEAKIAHIMLAVEATIAAWRAAYIDGAVSQGEFEARCKHAKARASNLIIELTQNVKTLTEAA